MGERWRSVRTSASTSDWVQRLTRGSEGGLPSLRLRDAVDFRESKR